MRREDWPERLAAIIAQARDVPFVWGRHDCVHWAISVAEELTGQPFGPRLPDYDDAASALRALRSMGHDGLFEAVEAALGAPIPPARAQRGDLGMVPTHYDNWPLALGVCLGLHVAVVGEQGLEYLPVGKAVAAWRVG